MTAIKVITYVDEDTNAKVVCSPSYKAFYHNNELKKVSFTDGSFELYSKGELHCTSGPAAQYASGKQEYWQNGKLHRIAGPAIITQSGYKAYYCLGLKHRDNGPAVKYANGDTEYWNKGIMRAKYVKGKRVF